MQERVSLTLGTGRVSLTAGDAPSTVDVTLTNRSQIVDQFDVTIGGGQPDWYEVTPNRVSLFPGESTTVKLNLHPPRRENVLAGRYEITVQATSRDDSEVTSIAGLEMTIVPSGGFQLQLPKGRDEGRSGSFRLRLANLSDAPLVLALAASDPETALTFFFPAVQLQLAAYEQRDFDFAIQPNRRPIKGEPRLYRFNVEATPQYPDRVQAARDTQRIQGEFVYKPRLQRWPWERLPGLVNLLVPAVAGIAALSAVLVASGAIGGGNNTPPPETPNIDATFTARDLAASATTGAANVASSATAAAATAIATQSVTPTPTETPTETPTVSLTVTPTPEDASLTPTLEAATPPPKVKPPVFATFIILTPGP
jgi:hypothetical protein